MGSPYKRVKADLFFILSNIWKFICELFFSNTWSLFSLRYYVDDIMRRYIILS